MGLRKVPTITLSDVKKSLRRGEKAALKNFGGWCVFVDGAQKQFYVVDDSEECQPVIFEQVRAIVRAHQSSHSTVSTQQTLS